MTRVKICGITRAEDALAAVDAGADAVGFVFTRSPRRVEPAHAAAIVRRLPPFVHTVGVFRDADADLVRRVAAACGIDVLQFHGDESPSYCAAFERPVVKVLRVGPDDDADRLRLRAAGFPVSARLLDPGAGDGVPFRWQIASQLPGPLIVAGGLDADNVAAALEACRPYGVDASSRLESRPGIKDAGRLRAFVRAVREHDARQAA